MMIKITSKTEQKNSYFLYLFLFLLFTFIWSWTLWVPELLYPNSQWVFFSSTLAIFGPSLIGFIITRLQSGRMGTKNLFHRGIILKFHWIWYLIILLLGPLYSGSAYLISNYGLHLGLESEMLQNPLTILIGFFYIYFLQGPLGEEFGWRGYALEKLQERLNPYWSSLILGCVWTLWHIPLFFMENTVQSEIPFWQFGIYTITVSFLITWAYNYSNKSVLAASIFHLMMNLSLGVFPYFQTTLSSIIGYSILAFFTLIIVLIFRKPTSSKNNL